MTHRNKLDTLELEMIEYYAHDPKRVQHFLKVHSLASLIGRSEHLPEHERFTLEAAALLHDIGIKPSEEKYGNANGKNQEKEGVAPATKMLARLEFHDDDIKRICFIIAHHHSYDNVQDPLLQIILEADFLVNLFEDDLSHEAISNFKNKVFKTQLGNNLCDFMTRK